jgi:hypothetical protein
LHFDTLAELGKARKTRHFGILIAAARAVSRRQVGSTARS